MRPRTRAGRHGWRRQLALITTGALAASALVGQPASAGPGQTAAITPDQQLYQVDEGGTAAIAVTLTTSDRRPLTGTAVLGYSAGAHRSGTVTFAAGSASGSVRHIDLTVPRDGTAETAETIPLTLRAATPALTVAAQPTVVVNANGLPYLDARLPIRRRVADLLGRMSLDDKVGQMTQAERGSVTDDPSRIAQLRLGSLLSGGGSAPTPNTPAAWVQMVNTFQRYALSTPLQIPLIYGIDAVHGHGNALGATIFPHNVGLGAARDPALTERAYHATAAEVRATGIPWDFAPCVCVSRDERWGRSYESFGEDPALAIAMETSVDGLQGRPGQLADPDRVLATVKHFAGDGDTEYGTGSGDYPIDQGVTVTNWADFARVDLSPYVAAVQRHRTGSVMPSFSSVDWTADGVGNPIKMHGNRQLITDVLKGAIGFDGLVVSDWEGIHQLPAADATPGTARPTAGQVRAGVDAGIDLFMEPYTAPQFEQLLRTEAAAGRISPARIDDAVRRILTAKFALGLFEHPFAPTDRVDLVGADAHRAIARRAAAESQVLLKNSGGALPLRRDAKLYVAGRNADNIGNQAGGWTVDWQGRSGASLPGTTILQGIRQVAPRATVTYSADASAPTGGADVGVVVVGETPYAEGLGDVGGPACGWCTPPQGELKSLTLQSADRAVLDKVCAAVPTCVVLVVSGRPQVVTDQLGQIDALVASWLPGSEGAGVADVLFGRRPFTGRLPVTWPRTVAQVPINVGDADYQPLYPFGWGLRTDPGRSRLAEAAGHRRGPALRALLAAGNWRPDGSLRTDARTLRLVDRAFAVSRGPVRDALLSVLRDAAQATVVAGAVDPRWASVLADADHAQLVGAPGRALRLLTSLVRS